jgi:hypothetical protein
MFVEMYARVLGGRRSEHDRIRRIVMDYAVAEVRPPGREHGKLGELFRRRRAARTSG